MTYRVVAPLVIAKDQEGRPYHVYADGIIQWLSPEQEAHFLDTGLVVKLGAEPADDGDTKPAASEKKEVLIDWIVANAVKEDGTDYTADELNALNKPQVVEILNSVE